MRKISLMHLNPRILEIESCTHELRTETISNSRLPN